MLSFLILSICDPFFEIFVSNILSLYFCFAVTVECKEGLNYNTLANYSLFQAELQEQQRLNHMQLDKSNKAGETESTDRNWSLSNSNVLSDDNDELLVFKPVRKRKIKTENSPVISKQQLIYMEKKKEFSNHPDVNGNKMNNFKQNDRQSSEYEDSLRINKQEETKADWKVLLNGNQKKTEANAKQTRFKRELKICPNYKKVAGTPFAVDAFEYGAIEGVSAYFLTHFHYDHYIGLRKSFSFPLYCTNITANLIRKKINVQEKYIHILKTNKSVVVNDVEVTCFDANHCPGSIILLFRLRNGQQHLHTGDFRANVSMEKYSLLSEHPVTNLYLDTTYCEERYVFPTQNEVTDTVKSIVREKSRQHPRALFICGSYTIGKEKVFMELINELQCKIWCDRYKKEVLDCLEDDLISSAIVDDPEAAKVHLLPMAKISLETIREYMLGLNDAFSHVFAFRPTGWEITSKNNWVNCSSSDNITIYGVPYSEHSSFPEICQFVKFLKPARIIPTVNVECRRTRSILKRLIDSYSDKLKQPTIDRFIRAKS